MTYRFLQGIDYGPRDGTLGISFHMSEGYDGLPAYLARHPGEDLHEWAGRVNGVSVHVAITSTGTVWQMLDWRHSSGNLNPDDRSGEYGYYGASKLKAVLGSHWPDPNAWTVTCELAGFRSAGPTEAQVHAAVQWGREMKAMFPTIRGTIGHHDQSPKPCPGLTANMRRIFDELGGHGLWTPEDDIQAMVISERHELGDVVRGVRFYDAPGGSDIGGFNNNQSVETVGVPMDLSVDKLNLGWRLVWVVTDAIDGKMTRKAVYVQTANVTNLRPVAPTSGDAAIHAALDHVLGPAQATVTAISEARPR